MNENENQNGSSRDRRESRDKKLFQNEKVNEINNLHISHFFLLFLKGGLEKIIKGIRNKG